MQLQQIRTDGGTQSRAQLHQDVVEQYRDILEGGTEFPAVIVYYDGATYWMADGFHRIAAYRLAERDELPTEVRQGTRLDALRYSIGANDTHGLRREPADMRRAYACAIENDLCAADDTTAVQGLLKCSLRWARELTREARTAAKAERDEQIAELAAEGRTQREIGEAVGMTNAGVNKVLGKKRNSSESYQTPKPTPPSTRSMAATNRKPAAERTEKIRQLVTTGHRASQIADHLGVSEQQVRKLAKVHDITLPDAQIGKARKIDARRIITETVNALEGCATGLQLITTLDDITPEEAAEMAESLAASVRQINALRKQLQEIING